MSPPTIADFLGSAEEANPIQKPTFEAEHAYGVLYQGPWHVKGDGFNEHTRRCARALALTGCPVHLRESGLRVNYGVPKDLDPEIAPLVRASIKNYSFSIRQMIASNEAALRAVTTHSFVPSELNEQMNRFKVISTVFERLRLPEGMIRALDRAAQVWVACKANADSLISSGLSADKVRIVPVPFFDDDPLIALRERKRVPGPPRFYHIGKWEPRKAQDKILLAFLRAFKPGEAQLIFRSSPLKVSIDGYPMGPREALAACLVNAPNGWTAAHAKQAIEIITEPLPAEAIVQLHSFGDVYVTLSRGEGFDMPAFDAKLAGNRMVYTPSGGPQDFDSLDDFYVDTSGDMLCHPFYGWEDGARYLNFDVEAAMQGMRTMAHEAMRGSIKTPIIRNWRNQASTVGQGMLRNLEELVQAEGKVF